jgi:hypothetical protein
MLTNYSVQPYGIWVFSTTTGVVIENNIVSNILNTNTGGYGARGIHVSTGMALTNITIRNNVVKHVRATSDATATYWGIGIGIEGATTGVNVYYNSVNLYDTLAGYSAATIHAAFAVITSTAGLLDVRDNVFARVCASGEPEFGLKDLVSRMSGRSAKTRNVLSMIESQGFRILRASAPGKLKLMPSPPGNAHQRLKDTSSRKSASKRTKGQPEGSAVTGKTRKPWVAEQV